jgi:adhesin HecA-like repeat protein
MEHLSKKYSWVILILFVNGLLRSQSLMTCTCNLNPTDSLTYYVFNTDTATYTLSAGKTLCIYAGGIFKGTVTNNGGTICNNGRFLPKAFSFTSGTIINSGMIKIGSILSLSTSKNILNGPKGVLTVSGGITLSGGSLSNEGIINSNGTLSNNSGTLDNRAIINCTALSGTNTITYHPSALINKKN